jgi:hypothetical protein
LLRTPKKGRPAPKNCYELWFNHPTENIDLGDHADELLIEYDRHADNVMRGHLGDERFDRFVLDADRWPSHDLLSLHGLQIFAFSDSIEEIEFSYHAYHHAFGIHDW